MTTPSSDQIVGELLPEELAWKDLALRYPKATVMVAAVGGYLLGRSRGPEILEALAGFAADRVTDGVNELLGEKVL